MIDLRKDDRFYVYRSILIIKLINDVVNKSNLWIIRVYLIKIVKICEEFKVLR